MSTPYEIFPRLEGIVGSIGTGVKQPVALWVKQMKEVMLSDKNKDKTDWEFAVSEDIDESANDIETGGKLYGILIGQNSADAETDFFVAANDADGTFTFDGSAALDNTVLFVTNLPAAATANTEEYHPFIFPHGISFSAHMVLGADGQDGANPGAR